LYLWAGFAAAGGDGVFGALGVAEEFAGALGGFDDGFDQRDTKAAFFEFENAVYCAAGGGGDGVA
jgi:hypothetical protein